MKLRVARIAVAAIAAEVLGVLALVVIVGIFGPPDAASTQAFAERAGLWVGPISGFVLCLAGGYWVARGTGDHAVHNGLGMGVAAAVVDIVVATFLGVGFHPLLAGSNGGRIVAGTIGGWLAKTS